MARYDFSVSAPWADEIEIKQRKRFATGRRNRYVQIKQCRASGGTMAVCTVRTRAGRTGRSNLGFSDQPARMEIVLRVTIGGTRYRQTFRQNVGSSQEVTYYLGDDNTITTQAPFVGIGGTTVNLLGTPANGAAQDRRTVGPGRRRNTTDSTGFTGPYGDKGSVYSPPEDESETALDDLGDGYSIAVTDLIPDSMWDAAAPYALPVGGAVLGSVAAAVLDRRALAGGILGGALGLGALWWHQQDASRQETEF